MSEQRVRIIKASLSHYRDKLSKLSELEDIPQIIRSELEKEYDKMNYLLANIDSFLSKRVFEQVRNFEAPNYEDDICSALQYYLYGLTKASLKISMELNNIKKFQSTNQELELVEKAIKDFRCNS